MPRLVIVILAALIALPATATAAPCPGADPCPYSASSVIGNRTGGVLRFPQASAVGPDGSVYVADQYSHAIQVFGPDGKFVREIGDPDRLTLGRRASPSARTGRSTSPTGATGSTASPPTAPSSSEWGKTGYGRRRVPLRPGRRQRLRRRRRARDRRRLPVRGRHAQRPDPADRARRQRRDRDRAARARVKRPQGLAARGGRLVVADDNGHRMVVYDYNGTQLTTFGSGPGPRPGQLSFPYDVGDRRARPRVRGRQHQPPRRPLRPGAVVHLPRALGLVRLAARAAAVPARDRRGAERRPVRRRPGRQPHRRLRLPGRAEGLLRQLRARDRAVHPAARRGHRRERRARGGRLRQRPRAAAEPGRQRDHRVRRARARADAAAGPGLRRRSTRAACCTCSTRSARACWSSTAAARSSAPSAAAARGAGQLLAPSAVAVSAAGVVYVADTGNGRIVRFTHQWHASRLDRALPERARRRGHAGRQPRLRDRRGHEPDHRDDRRRAATWPRSASGELRSPGRGRARRRRQRVRGRPRQRPRGRVLARRPALSARSARAGPARGSSSSRPASRSPATAS